jgi:hypothetical protein
MQICRKHAAICRPSDWTGCIFAYFLFFNSILLPYLRNSLTCQILRMWNVELTSVCWSVKNEYFVRRHCIIQLLQDRGYIYRRTSTSLRCDSWNIAVVRKLSSQQVKPTTVWQQALSFIAKRGLRKYSTATVVRQLNAPLSGAGCLNTVIMCHIFVYRSLIFFSRRDSP